MGLTVWFVEAYSNIHTHETMYCNTVACTDPVLRGGSTEAGDPGFHLRGDPAHPGNSLMPVHKSQVHTGQLHFGRGDDVEAFKQVGEALRPHDVILNDQPVGDWSTGSVESMEWQQHLQVVEEEKVVILTEPLEEQHRRRQRQLAVVDSGWQSVNPLEERQSSCGLALQHCFLDSITVKGHGECGHCGHGHSDRNRNDSDVSHNKTDDEILVLAKT